MRFDVTPRLVDRLVRGTVFDPGLGGCWLWFRSHNDMGYGQMTVRTPAGWRPERVHRVAWRVFHGALPEPPLCVLHRCHVRACWRPSHLYLGAKARNSQDMVEAGRSTVGDTNPAAKLTAADVAAIRADGSLGRQGLAKRYGVHPRHIDRLRRGGRWAHQRVQPSPSAPGAPNAPPE